METKSQISFVIVNYKSHNFLKDCLNSIQENSGDVNYEIIIVNNDEVVLDFPKAKILNLKSNKGFGAGCNVGAKIAQGEILCFLNPDAEILGNLNEIVRYFNSDKATGIIGPKLITSEDKIQHWCAGAETNLWNIFRNNLGLPRSKRTWDSQKPVKCDWVSGASLFIRRNTFSEVQGFDENFFVYYEDEDLCKRIREKGYKVIYFPGFSVKHLCGKSFTDKKEQKRMFYRSQDCYFEKHFGKTRCNLLKLIRKLTFK